MKIIFSIMLTLTLLLAGCSETKSNNSIKANNITIFYGFSSYAMFGADQAVIDDLLNQFNSLRFEKTTEEMDIGSAFNVNISCDGNGVRGFSVDKNGVFWLDGKTQGYKVSTGSFDYKHLKEIYEDSKNIPVGTALPNIFITHQNDNKAILKNELLIMIDKMTKPTQEKPMLAVSSNPYDYIEAHSDIFNQLVADGQNTLNIFVDVLKNSTEFGLDKYIMAIVCSEITGIGNDINKTWSTAKEWLELYNDGEGNP